MSNLTILNNKPVVNLINNQVSTTSLNVSQVFNKRHDHIIRNIKQIISDTPKEFTAPNFGVSEYKDSTGRNLPMYILTRDAFTLLAMGFTGKKAMQFKLAYIEAFNKMEAELKRQQEEKALPQTSALSTAADRKEIFSLVGKWAKQKGLFHKDCWKAIHKEFALHSISELPKDKIQDVCNFIAAQMGENLAPAVCEKSLPAPKPELTFLPVENKLPPLMFEYEPSDFAAFQARNMLERYGYKPYAYNAYMLSCKACELFNDFEQKIKELMKDYEKISKPVYSAMYAKVTDMDSEVLQDTSRHNTKEELDRHNACVNFTSTMWQTLDKTYSKFMYSRSDYLRNEVDQMIQTLRHTAKVLDM